MLDPYAHNNYIKEKIFLNRVPTKATVLRRGDDPKAHNNYSKEKTFLNHVPTRAIVLRRAHKGYSKDETCLTDMPTSVTIRRRNVSLTCPQDLQYRGDTLVPPAHKV